MGKGKREFWGLDFETSGVTHEQHAPIQLGICAPNGDWASWLISGWDWDWDHDTLGKTTWLWDLQAFEVHGITRKRLESEGQPIAEVTKEAVQFITDHSGVWLGERKLVGWNVGSFDAPFLRKHLAGIARELSYQSADLNAVCFAISQAHGISYKQVKREAQEAGARGAYNLTGIEDGLHDAGWDAVAALGAWRYLTGRIENGY